MQQLLGPWASVMDGKIAQWRNWAVNPAVTAERRQAADREFEESLGWFRSLQQSQYLASYINDMLQRAASTDDGNGLMVAAFRLQQTLRELERLTLELDPKLQQPMVDLIAQLRPFISGTESIPALRKSELDLTANATHLLAENVALSRGLSARVDELVENAKSDITGANVAALSVVQWSTWILIAAVVLSLASSVVIVWLYVGRNIIARLTALSDRTRADSRCGGRPRGLDKGKSCATSRGRPHAYPASQRWPLDPSQRAKNRKRRGSRDLCRHHRNEAPRSRTCRRA